MGMQFISPDYPQSSPEKSLEFLTQLIERELPDHNHQAWCIMGASLGSFYGQLLAKKYEVPLIMINPALNIYDLSMDYLGQHTHPDTGEIIKVDDHYVNALLSFKCHQPLSTEVLLLQDEGDEVVPYQYAYEFYRGHAERHLFKEGNHAFQHLQEAWPLITRFIDCSVKNSIKP